MINIDGVTRYHVEGHLSPVMAEIGAVMVWAGNRQVERYVIQFYSDTSSRRYDGSWSRGRTSLPVRGMGRKYETYAAAEASARRWFVKRNAVEVVR